MKRKGNEKAQVAKEKAQKTLGYKRTENRSFCLRCGRHVELLTIVDAAEYLEEDFSEVLDIAEAGELHLLHNSRGKIVVCAESVFEVFQKRPTQPFDPDIFKTNPLCSNILT